jgi:hypothetical protein
VTDDVQQSAPASRTSASGQGAPEERPRLLAELWYADVPDLNDPALVAALRSVSAATEEQDGSVTVPHTEMTVELEDGVVPLLTAILPGSPLDHRTKTLPDVSQTWDWAEAAEAVEQCTGSILVTELLAEHFLPQQRVSGLMSVLEVLVQRTSPLAISWPQSQRVTDPARFDRDALDGVINVRFFLVDDGDGEARLMDTLGLDLFELPDAQCHYRDFEPAEVAALLYTTAVYEFTEGDVIDDGHTISGPRGDERFVCRHEDALVGPPRIVLDIDLGDPYAAGDRHRT